MRFIVVTVEPVQQIAAEPKTLELLTADLRARISDRLEVPVSTGGIDGILGFPLVRDATLPAGFVYLRPFPDRPRPDEQMEEVNQR